MLSPMRYMGSKRSLAPRIAGLITRRHPKATVVDAFAGTCAIGTAVAATHRVVANDVHAFAEVIARALLVTPGRVPLPSEAWEELGTAYHKNTEALLESVGDRCEREKRLVAAASRPQGWKAFADFTLDELDKPVPRRLHGLPSLATYRSDQATRPYSLFTRYFAGAYVGIQQAIELDSIRCAIDSVSSDRRDFYLFALLHALSFCATSPGHFAQFLVPRDEKNTYLFTGLIF
jgi:adenine-specific DNA methylase